MSTPNAVPPSSWKSKATFLISIALSAVLAAIGTYYSTMYANLASSASDQATRYVDFQIVKENNVTGFFQIPGVTLSYKDEKGNSLKALSLVKVELQNFSSRDIASVDLQIDATARNDAPPMLQTFRIGNGPAEDFDAEKNITQTVKHGTLSISIPLKSINRTEAFAPARTLLLYFKGASAPDVMVSTNAAGVSARPFAYQHYLDSENSHQSFIQRYGSQIVTVSNTALFALWFGLSTWLIVAGRKREVANMVHAVAVVENMIQGLPSQPIPPAQQHDFAKNFVFEFWCAAYQRAWRISRPLSVAPDRSKL
ncbi:MAG: hypothetical protein GAK33_03144 [Burkholderia lata]|uniref:Uncharacterized protein n=1 Tax=Burkholderia lata (strain ATCC 17760 / DSM 23089 / LMG 22485 / NCIMB 9086 / R18194 / 383) TaxID=482957 RepID=A0A833V0S2_BURL3|nr:MAG: hypothetical protein GAK33_03144 [Burkholderia lata]